MPTHPFPPSGLSKDSKILILGSFPSVASRQIGFYYAHPQNRFWKALELLFKDENIAYNAIITPNTNATGYKQNIPLSMQPMFAKIEFLKSHFLVLWDIVKSCKIKGSSDSSLKDYEFNDIFTLLHSSKIQTICLNGTKATNLFCQYCKQQHYTISIHTSPLHKILTPKPSFLQQFKREIQVVSLPSTSPANARYSLDNLLKTWKVLLEI